MATIRHSIDVKAPVHTLYSQLTHFEDYPRFMDEVESVRKLDDTHLHWKARMAGQPLEWDAEINEQQEDRCIAWRNLAGPAGAGRVDLQPAGESGSRLTFTLQASPEPQATEEEMAQRVHERLIRLKEIVEQAASEERQSSYAAGSESIVDEEALAEHSAHLHSSHIPPRKAAALRNDSAGSVSKHSTLPLPQEKTMQIVSEVMTPDVRFVSPQESLQRAAQMMDELNVGALPVCDGRKLVGMVTDRDITVRGTAAGKTPADTHVEEVMSGDVRWCFEDQPLEEVMQQMVDTQIRRVPVISHDDERKLIGIVSLGDIATKSESEAKSDVEDVVEKIASPSEPDRSPIRGARPARMPTKEDAAYPPGVTARIDPSGGTSDKRHAGNKDDSGSISAGAEDAGTSGGVAGTAGSGGSDLSDNGGP